MEKKSVKKTTTKKKATTKKAPVKKTVKKEPVKKETVVIEKKKEEVVKQPIGKLVYAILYFLCSAVWVVCGVNRAMALEKFAFDIIVSIILFAISVIYYISYRKDLKLTKKN